MTETRSSSTSQPDLLTSQILDSLTYQLYLIVDKYLKIFIYADI
jgi:hypothetical protein